MIDILEINEFKKGDSIIAKHIFTHMERVGKLAASREDEDSVLEVVTSIFMIGKAALEQELENVAGEAVNSIKNIGRLAIKREMEDMEMIITDLIGEIGKTSAEKGLDFTTSVSINSLGIIGKEAAKHAQQGLEETVWMAGSIYEIAKLAVKHKLTQSIFYSINAIGEMGKYTARNDLPKTTIRIVDYLKNLGLANLDENLYENTNNVVDYLGEVGRIAVWSELNVMALRKLLKRVQYSLEDIMEKAKEKGFAHTVSIVESSSKKIEKLIKEQQLDDRGSNLSLQPE